MYILYDAASSWETDYIRNDILAGIFARPDTRAFLLSTAELASLRDVASEHPLVGNCCIVFTSNHISSADIIAVAKTCRPHAIIHLSDEWGLHPEYLELAELTPIYMRQYAHAGYSTYMHAAEHAAEHTAVPRQIPLGYMQGMLGGQPSTTVIATQKKPATRRYTWSFVGELKQDRTEMLRTFLRELPTGHVTRGKTPQEMFAIYQDSLFVISGRGNASLDCFRLYEATIAGAIPVVVGTEEELAATFHYGGDRPPFLYATTWDDATRKCKEVLYDISRAEKIQDALRTWWCRQIQGAREAASSNECTSM
jgi:hypothetical protein